MDGMLSQEEIDALTGGNSATSKADSGSSSEHTLTAQKETPLERLPTSIWGLRLQHYQRC